MMYPPTNQIPPADVEKFVDEHKLLRILNPSLQAKIERTASPSPYLIRRKEGLYISLDHIPEPSTRQRIYAVVQQYQLEPDENLDDIPPELAGLLQQSATLQFDTFWTALLIGGVIGIFFGVLVMAITTLFINMTAITLGMEVVGLADVQITAVIFVLASAFGWLITSLIAWRWLSKRQTEQELG